MWFQLVDTNQIWNAYEITLITNFFAFVLESFTRRIPTTGYTK
jgi:hypothetical protein